jgi:hypothetical protein
MAGVLSDLRRYVVQTPEVSTLVDIRSPEEREESNRRILQRLPISVDQYRVLNVHRIGIRTPVAFALDELLRWSDDPPFWPNHLATVDNLHGRFERIRFLLCGRWTDSIRRLLDKHAPDFGTLFRMRLLRFQDVPPADEPDNARYLLYECSGGYPIGVFCIYLRSRIAELAEVEETQFYFTVSFNFYGRQEWPGVRAMDAIWQRIHNRVTANVLVRFRRHCETEFRAMTDGRDSAGRGQSATADVR